MLNESLQSLIVRELRAVQRELDLYPDDASVWKAIPGVPNTAGTLALHLAGNLQHFIGAILGRSGYERDRDAEFARRDVPRTELKAGLDAAIAAVERTFSALPSNALDAPWPEPIAKRSVHATTFGLHLLAHLAYHLGQIDTHRRAVTGSATGVDAVSVRELPEVA
ncbi:MAG TPA: DinB family protein [Gemmatimonadaceae bacterium]|nr:DinB family protein [Gemmatimonadaceae bacterium]